MTPLRHFDYMHNLINIFVSVVMYTVLDRVKMFLPQMAQANLELEKQIAGEGSDSVVIDKTILAEAEDSDEEEEEEEVGVYIPVYISYIY